MTHPRLEATSFLSRNWANSSLLHSFVVAAVVCATIACGLTRRERRVQEISKSIIAVARDVDAEDRVLRTRVQKIWKNYAETDLSSASLRQYSDETIRRLFESLFVASFYQPDEESFLNVQSLIFDEMARRKIVSEFDARKMCKGFLSARKFNEAKALKVQFPDFKLPKVPELVKESDPSRLARRWGSYDVLDGGQQVMPISLPFDAGPSIVMVMATGCSAAQHALKDILADPAMSESFRKYGYLVSDKFDSVGISKWRKHFDFPRVYLAGQRKLFPGMSFDSFPHFYFLSDGKVLADFDGWGEEGIAGFKAGVSKLRDIEISRQPTLSARANRIKKSKPQVLMTLRKLIPNAPQKDLIDFAMGLRVANGYIVSADFDPLMRSLDSEAIERVNSFIAAQVIEQPIRKRRAPSPVVHLADVLRGISGKPLATFCENILIRKGRIVSLYWGGLRNHVDKQAIENILVAILPNDVGTSSLNTPYESESICRASPSASGFNCASRINWACSLACR